MKLESELAVVKQVNEVLHGRLIEVERKTFINEQYSRKEFLEISGIPESIDDNQLESTVCSVLNSIGSPVSPDGIQACHRISKKNKNVILKLVRRKDCFNTLQAKRKLDDVDLNSLLGITGKVYLN